MKNSIHFENNGDGTFEVCEWLDAEGYDWNTLGTLEFDRVQNAWIFWQAGTDQGVTYFDSLKETEETVQVELFN